MRRASFLLLFIVLGSLLAAAPVRAETAQYYGIELSKGSYLVASVNASMIKTFEFLVNIGRCVDRYDYNTTGYCVLASSPSLGTNFTYILTTEWGKFYLKKGGEYTVVSTGKMMKGTHDIIVVFDDGSDTATIYVDGKKLWSGALDIGPTLQGLRFFDSPVSDSNGVPRYQLEGAAYVVRAWDRVLSDEEIQAIYADPLNSPTSGLVLFYAPDSVDTVNNVWKDKSGNGNDGAIHGAEAVKVSIPDVVAWDTVRNRPIPLIDLMIKDLAGVNFLPTFLALPYDKTIVLNVSAPGYYPSLFTVQAPMLSLNFTLTPIPTYVVVGEGAAVIYAKGNESVSLKNLLGIFTLWPGGKIGVKFMLLDIKGALIEFFNDTTIPYLGMVVAVLLWYAGVVLAWIYSKRAAFTILWGFILYKGLSDFIYIQDYFKYFSTLLVPLAVVLSAYYLKEALDTFGGE